MKYAEVPGGDQRIWTLSGRSFDLFTPPREFGKYAGDFNLNDIATGLSHICRWGGQVSEFYSVAQHCLMAAEILSDIAPAHAYHGLMHDAAEAYIDDMQRPLKINFPEYRRVEGLLEKTLMPVLGVPVEKSPEVRTVDAFLAYAEASELGLSRVFADPAYAEFRAKADGFFSHIGRRKSDCVLSCEYPADARDDFLRAFHALKPAHVKVEADGSIRNPLRGELARKTRARP